MIKIVISMTIKSGCIHKISLPWRCPPSESSDDSEEEEDPDDEPESELDELEELDVEDLSPKDRLVPVLLAGTWFAWMIPRIY